MYLEEEKLGGGALEKAPNTTSTKRNNKGPPGAKKMEKSLMAQDLLKMMHLDTSIPKEKRKRKEKKRRKRKKKYSWASKAEIATCCCDPPLVHSRQVPNAGHAPRTKKKVSASTDTNVLQKHVIALEPKAFQFR